MTTETTVSNLKINKLTKAQYNTITPSDTELYFVTDEGPSSYEATNPALTPSSDICTWTITHSLGETVSISVYSTSTGEEVLSQAIILSSSQAFVKLFSTSNISAGAYRAVIISG
jgi:hypothetical protein